MAEHHYWAYAAVPGTLTSYEEQAAVDEGRRERALDLATRYDDTDGGYLARARKFEAYLKGDAVEDVNGAPLDG